MNFKFKLKKIWQSCFLIGASKRNHFTAQMQKKSLPKKYKKKKPLRMVSALRHFHYNCFKTSRRVLFITFCLSLS